MWVCVCSLRYPACNAHTPYHIIIYGQSDLTIFFHVLKNGKIFEKKKMNIKYSFGFLYKFVCKIFHTKKNWARYDRKCVSVCMQSAGCSCHIIMKLEILKKISKNIQISNFMKIRPVRTEFFYADGQTERRRDMT